MLDAIIDYETLDKGENCVILSLGAIVFDFNKEYTFDELIDDSFTGGLNLKFEVEDQIKNYGRTISRDTIDWWKGQGEDAQKVICRSPDDVKFADAVKIFDDFLIREGMMESSQIYCRGQDFDIPIMKSMYKQVGISEPIKFWNSRDIRTAIQCWTGERRGRNFASEGLYKEQFIKHDAFHDCAAAVIDMQQALKGFINGAN